MRHLRQGSHGGAGEGPDEDAAEGGPGFPERRHLQHQDPPEEVLWEAAQKSHLGGGAEAVPGLGCV